MKKATLLIVLILFLFLTSLPIQSGYSAVNISFAGGTITVSGSGSCNLTDIDTAIGNPDVLNEVSSKVWLLNATLYVSSANVDLFINLTDCEELRIKSVGSLQRQLKWKGNLYIYDTAIYGWNTTYDTISTDGRSRLYTSYSMNFHAENSTFAYLGCGVHRDNASIGIWFNDPLWTVSAVNCTFHNCSRVLIETTAVAEFDGCHFYDFTENYTLWFQYLNIAIVNNTVFDNCRMPLDFYLCNSPSAIIKVENTNITNMLWENETIIGIDDSKNAYFDNCRIENAGNNTIKIRWGTQNVTFNRLFMNWTGLAPYTGFTGDTLSSHVYFYNSIFHYINSVTFKRTDYVHAVNCSLNGHNVTEWGFILGDYGYINNCTVYNIQRDALSVASNGIIEHCVTNGTDRGVTIHTGPSWDWIPISNVTIRYNTIVNCTNGQDAWWTGISVAGTAIAGTESKPNGVYIYNNTIEGGTMGILLYAGARNVEIYNNTISLSEWETGEMIPPFGYNTTQNAWTFRANAGIYLARELDVSWNWTQHKLCKLYNITIGYNDYNSTYMNCFIWADKGVLGNDITLFSAAPDLSGFDGEYTKFEFTEDFYNGSILWLVNSNPIYEKIKADGEHVLWAGEFGTICNATFHMSLNTTHFGFWTDVNATAISIASQYNYAGIATYTLDDPYNVSETRHYTLFTDPDDANLKHGWWWRVMGGAYPFEIRLYYQIEGATAENDTFTIHGDRPRTITFNGVANTTLWSYTAATKTAYINWTYDSPVLIVVYYDLPVVDILSWLIMPMMGISGFVLCGIGIFYVGQKIRERDVFGTIKATLYAMLIVLIGAGLIIGWLW